MKKNQRNSESNNPDLYEDVLRQEKLDPYEALIKLNMLQKQNSKSIASLLSSIYLSLILNLGVLVELKSGDVLATNSEIIEGAGKLGIDTVALQDVEKLRQDNFSKDLEDRKRLLEKVMQCVRDAAAMADKL